MNDWVAFSNIGFERAKYFYKKEYMKRYSIENSEKIRIKRKEYNLKNKERCKKYGKEYRSRPKIKERSKKYKKEYNQRESSKKLKSKHDKTYRLKHKEEMKKYLKKYMNNPEMIERIRKRLGEYYRRPEVRKRIRKRRKTKEVKLRDKIYNKKYYSRKDVRKRVNEKKRKRFKTDVNFVIRERLRTRLRPLVKRYITKGLLPKPSIFNFEEVCRHLNNTKPLNWRKCHIDHIKPLCSFDLTDEKQVIQANHYTNLQWLTPEQNFSKGGRYKNVQ